ncbi:2-hydroxyhepta-2,4-diene-1,7-dioate isomerase [Ensifer adhaerens]|uniref:2-hydroxyhepta-2,4-diene-1,7-dioate isomerase n=1 Tax=Ensifer adhaerens TaxID=106592 RepID=A0A0L8BZW6_ENSAD|nr:fumarylacetoacetate hydrolase family protein [Ensifer adhaerens]KOF20118.1 2-hydroxyhepta-2,4-diene-1,7-dioate isomerase [Ensifer adhaerens]
MKLLRLDIAGSVTPCALDTEGAARDLSSVVSDISASVLATSLDALLATDLSALPKVSFDGADLLPPVPTPRTIWCIGLNYSDHAEEAGLPVPLEPILFNKSAATFCGPNAPLLHSPKMSKLDWEVELGIVIGKHTLSVSPDKAMDHVLGYTVVNDVSERSWQMERGGQWVKGKSFPNFCPTGPWLVTRDEVPDPQDLSMWLDVNGERMQSGNTARMIFDVRTIVSYMSEFCALEPGDLICTGTPPGVGMGQKPPRYLRPGDVVELGIEGLGQQRQTVRAI